MSMRRVLPRSSQTVACDRFSRKRRSWLMRTRAPRCCGQARLEPLDGRQVEVVGRLVQQQDVGRRRQHVGQRRPAQLAARQRCRVLLAARAPAAAADSAPDADRRWGRARPPRRPAWWRGRRGPAPAAGSAPTAPGCMKRSPRSGSIRPAAILSSVDLPEPLRPTRHTRSPGATASSAPSSSGVPPKVRCDVAELEEGRGGGHWALYSALAPRCLPRRGLRCRRDVPGEKWWARQGSNL